MTERRGPIRRARGHPIGLMRLLLAAVASAAARAARAAPAVSAIPAILAFLGAPLAAATLQAQAAPRGKAVYDQWCAGCHGETGAGDGPGAAFMLPPPRDFTRAVYQIRTTASGEIPTDADILRVIDEGMPGTAMPGWRKKLSQRERDDLVAYLKSFSAFFEGQPPTQVRIGRAPRGGDDAIAEGRRVYQTLECFKCHGQGGRGDGPSAPTLTDDWDHPIRAADLTRSWTFNGGSSVEEIYTRLRTGLDGTPMPSFTDAIEGNVITDEQLWRVAQYVRSLSPGDAPRVREVIRAVRVDETLPRGPTDTAWAEIEPHYIPLVGQIIQKPRWFAPTVDGVWIRAAHDGERLALHLTWHDPSRSPDPAWDEWFGRVQRSMTGIDTAAPAVHGPDRLGVQFPAALAQESERPYFLRGSARRPVYLWRWTSAPDAVEEGTATGLGQFTAGAGGAEVTHASAFEDGAWRLQLTRAMTPADTAAAITFPEGRAIPIAFWVGDGSNGEDELRASISAWYALYLDVATPPRVYVAPLSTMLLTAGIGLLVIRQAQRRERKPVRSTSEES